MTKNRSVKVIANDLVCPGEIEASLCLKVIGTCQQNSLKSNIKSHLNRGLYMRQPGFADLSRGLPLLCFFAKKLYGCLDYYKDKVTVTDILNAVLASRFGQADVALSHFLGFAVNYHLTFAVDDVIDLFVPFLRV